MAVAALRVLLPFIQMACDIPFSGILLPLIGPIIPTPFSITVFLILLFIFIMPKNSFVNGSNSTEGKRKWSKAAM